MSDLSWAPALILTGGSFIVLSIAAALLSTWLKAQARKKRRRARLYKTGNIYWMGNDE